MIFWLGTTTITNYPTRSNTIAFKKDYGIPKGHVIYYLKKHLHWSRQVIQGQVLQPFKDNTLSLCPSIYICIYAHAFTLNANTSRLFSDPVIDMRCFGLTGKTTGAQQPQK